MLLLKLDYMSNSVVKVSNHAILNYSYVDRDHHSGAGAGGILRDVKITYFEPVYVQQIKLYETSYTTKNMKISNNFLSCYKLIKLILMIIIIIIIIIFFHVRMSELRKS